MNEIVNKLLLAGDRFMPDLHLKQQQQKKPIKILKNKTKMIAKFMQTGNTDFSYKNKLDKACFQHDMAYGKSKDLANTAQSNKILRYKASKIASNPK